MEQNTEYTFDDFVEIVRELRKKCPWDSVQTHTSLRTCLENESREVLDGISILEETGDGANLCEELGDVLLQIVLHSIIAQEEGLFTVEDVISGISRKMKFRHPKIFRTGGQRGGSHELGRAETGRTYFTGKTGK